MYDSITHLISWDSIWNPYSFPGAKRIVMLLVLTMAGSVLLTAIFFGMKKAAVILKRELLLFWLFTIFSATLLARKESPESKINLDLFWTIRYAWEHRSGIHWFYILGNIALFIPLGFLLPVNGRVFRSCFLTVFMGFLLSAAIEASQYFWKLGLCELDDVLHNTWGALLGYCFYRLVVPELNKRTAGKKAMYIARKCGCAIIILGTVFLFMALLRLNPPL